MLWMFPGNRKPMLKFPGFLFAEKPEPAQNPHGEIMHGLYALLQKKS